MPDEVNACFLQFAQIRFGALARYSFGSISQLQEQERAQAHFSTAEMTTVTIERILRIKFSSFDIFRANPYPVT